MVQRRQTAGTARTSDPASSKVAAAKMTPLRLNTLHDRIIKAMQAMKKAGKKSVTTVEVAEYLGDVKDIWKRFSELYTNKFLIVPTGKMRTIASNPLQCWRLAKKKETAYLIAFCSTLATPEPTLLALLEEVQRNKELRKALKNASQAVQDKIAAYKRKLALTAEGQSIGFKAFMKRYPL